MQPITSHRLIYDGKESQLYKIWLLNLLLQIVTFGIYAFWGRTRIRRYLASSFSLFGDRFQYTGTGKELFTGFLKALPIILALYTPIIALGEKYPVANFLLIVVIYFYFIGTYTAMRYKLSRIKWRGIRGGLDGSPIHYANLKIICWLVNVLTLGLATPYCDIKVEGYKMNNTLLGTARAEFKGKPLALMGVNFATLSLFIPTLSFSRFWYKAALMNHIYDNTAIGGLRFKGSITGGKLLGLYLGNLLLFFLSFGLATPIIIQRNMNFLSDSIEILGNPETSAILQATGKIGKSGEGIDALLGEHDLGFI